MSDIQYLTLQTETQRSRMSESVPKKTLTWFKDLPDGVYRSFLLPYLSLNELCVFDSSLTNHQERNWYLLAISGSNKTIDAHEHVSFQTIAWLIHRGVHILPENLVLRVQNEWEPKRDDLLLVAAKEYSKDNDAKIVLNYLLSQNIDINTVSRSRNCLKIAIMNDDVEFVSLLLDHGANVEKLP